MPEFDTEFYKLIAQIYLNECLMLILPKIHQEDSSHAVNLIPKASVRLVFLFDSLLEVLF